MKKKGFTLIELLAVIVVLAIIALIATPIVMNTIKKSQKGAAERSADNYIDAVETAVATARLDNNDVPDGTYTIDENGNLLVPSLPNGKLTIEMNGNKPKGGTITIKNGQVTTDSKMTVGSYEVSYNPTTNKYEASEEGTSTKTYANGEVVYFNVTTGEKCSASDYTDDIMEKDGCLKFYAFNDEGGNKVNLLLDHNTTATVAWNSSKSNTNGPKEILDSLKTATASWKGTETPANYTMDQTSKTSKASYTIDYSGYKARLITAQEIAQIVGNTSWDEKSASSEYYFDSKSSFASSTCTSGNTTGCQYGWLYDKTSASCTTYGCLNNSGNRYWTASSYSGDSSNAWYVDYSGSIGNDGVNYPGFYGVRPVIEVLKSKLS